MNTSRPVRPAVRALVLDDTDNVLLVRLCFPYGSWWVLPGGGIQPDESEHDALHRELTEEIGLVSAVIGEPVWLRTHMFDFVDTDGFSWMGQHETVFLVRTNRFEPQPHMSPEELVAENIDCFRWWSREELSTYEGPDHLSPPDLSIYVDEIISTGVPHTPFVIHQSN